MKFNTYCLIFFAIASCTAKKMSMTSENSKRGDAVFSKIVPDNNYGKIQDIHIYSWTQDGGVNVNRVLVDFDLSQIPANAVITEAYLDLFFNPTSPYDKGLPNEEVGGMDSIIIKRVTSEWSEANVTWSKQPHTSSENQVIIPKKKDTKANYLNINVTAIVLDMMKSRNESFGFMIRHKTEEPYNVVFFASKDHPQKELHPTLRVKYKLKKF